jgi:hypothetical protein
VPGSLRDKATSRTGRYRNDIAAAQAGGDYRGALHQSERWLLGEVAKFARQRPQDAQQMYAEVTEKLAALAEAIPFYRPARKG